MRAGELSLCIEFHRISTQHCVYLLGKRRLAMLGFASALIGEVTTGRGALGQLQLELGEQFLSFDQIVA